MVTVEYLRDDVEFAGVALIVPVSWTEKTDSNPKSFLYPNFQPSDGGRAPWLWSALTVRNNRNVKSGWLEFSIATVIEEKANFFVLLLMIGFT